MGGAWGGGRLFQLLAGPSDVVIERNTAVHTDNIITVDGEPLTRFVYSDNITPHNAYGIIGSGTGTGRLTIGRYFPGGVIKHNVIAGGDPISTRRTICSPHRSTRSASSTARAAITVWRRRAGSARPAPADEIRASISIAWSLRCPARTCRPCSK